MLVLDGSDRAEQCGSFERLIGHVTDRSFLFFSLSNLPCIYFQL